jgi:hypothetical protein
MKKLETKDFKFTLDSFDDEKGTFTGYASVFGVVDSYRDIVDKGAFKKSLKDKKEFPILWSHNIMEPIGVALLKEDDMGLRIEAGKLNLDVQRAKEVRSLMKQGAIEGISFGYQTIDAKPDRDDPQTRHLREVKLWEISPCVFPACGEAQVDEVKDALSPGEPPPGTPLEEPPDTKSDPVTDQLLGKLLDEVESFYKILGGKTS